MLLLLWHEGNPFKCHEEVLYLQPMILPKRFAIFSPWLGDAQKVKVRSDFSLNNNGSADTNPILDPM